MELADVLVIGAGLSGLMAAQALQNQGLTVTVLDKGRSVGGRLATRRIGPGRADHGAQFFTARTPEFQARIDAWLEAGLVYRWSTGWSDGSLESTPPDGYPRYVVQGGMNRLAKHLAQSLDTRVGVQITAVFSPTETGWQAQTAQGQTLSGRALLLTPPVPQSLALLDAGYPALTVPDRLALEQIEYAPCLAGLFQVDGPVRLPKPGAIQRPDAPISWIADNRRKGISPEATIVTVHAGPAYSRTNWRRPDTEILPDLQAALQPFLAPTSQIVETQLKRWRYALPTRLHPERCLHAVGLPPLVFAGDAFGGPRVEGAALSGLAAAAALRNLI